MAEELIAYIQSIKDGSGISLNLKRKVELFACKLFQVLFDTDADTQEGLSELAILFKEVRDGVCPDKKDTPCKNWDDFIIKIPQLFTRLNEDAQAIYDNDPAASSLDEVYLAYPGFYAIAIYRMAREFYLMGLPLIPRLMTEYAHRETGVDIHPGAKIGHSFFIDHATGVVIGETAEIHDNVKIYQGVTLGALVVEKRMRNVKRHPTVESYVTIYANATILGGDTVIGKHSIIGGNVWLTHSIPAHSVVSHDPEINIKTHAS